MKNFSLLIMVICLAFLVPGSAVAAGLGEAGSMTPEGLVIGLAVLGIIFLAFMGLLLLARVRELGYLLKKKDLPTGHFKPEDVMSLNADEIKVLLDDRIKTGKS